MVSYPIFISKLEYYGVRGIANNWFQSFLTNRKQFTSVNDYNSTYQQITHCVPQGSVLGILLLLLFINDLHLFVNDDIHLLFTNNSLKNKQLHKPCPYPINTLAEENKICLNATKAETVIFLPKHKSITKHMNFRIIVQRVHLFRKVR